MDKRSAGFWHKYFAVKPSKNFILGLIFALFLGMRLVGLGGDIANSDEIRWHVRSTAFLQALKTLDLKSTYQHYQPGVTLMWVEVPTRVAISLFNITKFSVVHSLYKLPIIFVLALLLFIHFKFISEIFNRKAALIYAFLMAVEPYLIGIDRWVHLTSFETYFSFASLLALLVWYKKKSQKHLVFSSLLLALAILSKTTSLILIPVCLIVFTVDIARSGKIRNVFLFGLCTAIFFFILFPAMWTDSARVLYKLDRSIRGAAEGTMRQDTVPISLHNYFYLLVLVFKISPITLVLFLLGLKKTRKNLNTFVVFFMLVLYGIALTIAGQKIDRYILVFFPGILLISALFLSELKPRVRNIFLALSVLNLIFTIYIYHPVYSAYYSPIFGGTRAALRWGVYDNSGEYYAQAAQYLSKKPEIIDTFVPNGWDSFAPYYTKRMQRGFDLKNVEYIVGSLNTNRREINETICPTMEKSFGPRGFPVVFVFRCGKG